MKVNSRRYTLERQARPHNSRYTIHKALVLRFATRLRLAENLGFRILVHRVAATRRSEKCWHKHKEKN
jgi:hypothetical protein